MKGTYLYVGRWVVAQANGMARQGASAILPGALNEGIQREYFQSKESPVRPLGRSEMFLADTCLCQLSGLKRPSAVRRWLEAQRIPYMVGADGWPRVLDTIIRERLGLGQDTSTIQEPQLRLRHG
jgi:hypothetical protein